MITQNPTQIKIFPTLLLTAMKVHLETPYRFWFCLKHFNQSGSGKVSMQSFKEFASNEIEIPPSSFYRWLHECSKIELLKIEKSAILIASYKTAFSFVNCFEVGYPVYIERSKLFKKGWRSAIWAGYLKSQGFENRPISRRFLKEVSGIPERTQRDYHKRARIYSHSNYAKIPNSKVPREIVDGINEFHEDPLRSKAFLRDGEIHWQLPNDYCVSKIQIGSRKSSQRINHQLLDLKKDGGRASEVENLIRVYCKNNWQVESSLRKIEKLSKGKLIDLPRTLYLKSEKQGIYHAKEI
jgi:hypothetical protein